MKITADSFKLILILSAILNLTSACSNKSGPSKSSAVAETPSNPPALAAPKITYHSSNSDVAGWTKTASLGSTFIFSIDSGTDLTAECWLRPKASTDSENYLPCGQVEAGQLVIDIHSLKSSQPDGSLKLSVRAKSGEKISEVVTQEIYIHSSLNEAEKCSTSASDEQIFQKASEFLALNQADFDNETKLANPNINLKFNDGRNVEIMSLRRKFSLSADKKLVLVKRAFASKTTGLCVNNLKVGEKRSNRGLNKTTLDCPLMVINSGGSGVCLQDNGTEVSFLRKFNKADAKLDNSGNTKFFSRKTKDRSVAEQNPDYLFLPD